MKLYEKDQTRYAIILAGGDGTRLSEITRRISGDSTPKQFCPVIGSTSLLETNPVFAFRSQSTRIGFSPCSTARTSAITAIWSMRSCRRTS